MRKKYWNQERIAICLDQMVCQSHQMIQTEKESKTTRIYVPIILLVSNSATQRDPKASLQLNWTDQREYNA